MSENAQNNNIPAHIAIIPDGNRRWARNKSLPIFNGHEKGFGVFRSIAEKAFVLGVKVLSVWVFSTENWNRDKSEVEYLMKYFIKYFKAEAEPMNKQGIKVIVSGSKDRLPEELLTAINNIEQLTVNNSHGILNICLNYGGRQEIVDAVNHMLQEKPTQIGPEDIRKHLYHDLPDVDLIIRTSGERRLSGFMPWLGGYAELHFIEKHWPDFNPTDLEQAVADYQARQRRFGK